MKLYVLIGLVNYEASTYLGIFLTENDAVNHFETVKNRFDDYDIFDEEIVFEIKK